MSFIPTIILFYIVSFTKIKCSKPISFTIQIKRGKNFTIPLFKSKIGNTSIDTVYSGLNSTSEIFYAFTPKKNCIKLNDIMNGQCYYGDEKKKLTQNKTISFFGQKENGPLYKENITIGETNFELEFVYVNILYMYNGYINFGSKSLQLLKDKSIIPSINIHYGPYNESEGSMKVIVGGNYSTNNKKHFDECDIVEKISGCILKKIVIFDNNTKDNNKTFDINVKAEFFNSELYQTNETVVTGNINTINDITTKLKKNNFTCVDKGIIHCQSPNKTLFLYFGKIGMKLNKIHFYQKAHPHLVFGFNTFKNMDIVIDYEKNKVFFYSGDNENPSNPNTNQKKTPKEPFYKNKYFIIIAIIVVVLIIAIIIFYFLFHKKEQANFGISGAETLLEN